MATVAPEPSATSGESAADPGAHGDAKAPEGTRPKRPGAVAWTSICRALARILRAGGSQTTSAPSTSTTASPERHASPRGHAIASEGASSPVRVSSLTTPLSVAMRRSSPPTNAKGASGAGCGAGRAAARTEMAASTLAARFSSA